MATSFLKKTMVYLGLLDDEYDEYDDYDDRQPRGSSPVSRVDHEPPTADETKSRPSPRPAPALGQADPDHAAGRPPPAAPPSTITPARRCRVRPMVTDDRPRSHVVAPARFGDAKEIADCLKANRPVIVNLQVAERDLQRRMIDFCSGVTYALSGEMEKVADQVFLLAPTNVKVSDEERQRLPGARLRASLTS